MAVLDSINSSTLQFVADALRTMSHPIQNLDLTKEINRRLISTLSDVHPNGRPAIRNPDGTALTIAQIAAATNLTVAQVTNIAGRL